MTIPSAGTMAPDFTLDTDAGTPLTLSDLRGTAVVLFFYPKDDTSGCTIESCEFRDSLSRFASADAAVLGISPDPVKSHVKFREKYQLNYPLLADVDKTVSTAYGVWQEKSMWGRKYMGVVRTTFLIDRDGRIARVFEKVNPEGHAADVAEAVATLH